MFFTLLQKELRHYFNSPIAYIFLLAFYGMSGWFFIFPFFINNQASLTAFFQPLPMLLIFFTPALSMRTFAEEKKQGTLETLLTLPLKDNTIIFAKFTAIVLCMAIALLGTFLFAAIAQYLGPVEWGAVISGYMGALLLATTMLSYGICISSFTKNQIIAFIITSVCSLTLILSGILQEHYEAFLRGIIDLQDVFFFLSLIVLMLVITREGLRYRHLS